MEIFKCELVEKDGTEQLTIHIPKAVNHMSVLKGLTMLCVAASEELNGSFEDVLHDIKVCKEKWYDVD